VHGKLKIKETAEYVIELGATEARPFIGDFRININLFNPDRGSSLDDGGFFQDSGDEMARAMIGIHPAVTRLRPPLKDWNEVLKRRP
jgi:hypothetical protein